MTAERVHRTRSERDAFGEALLRLATDRVGDRDEARVAVSHALEALRRRSVAGERVGNPKSFLSQAVRDFTADAAARRGAAPRTRGRRLERHFEFDHQRRLSAYRRTLGRLAKRDRRIFFLRHLRNLTAVETAARTRQPLSLIEKRLGFALRRCWEAVRPRENARLERLDPVLEAIGWQASLQGGAMDRAGLLELEGWLRASANHRQAYRSAEALWRDSALREAAQEVEEQGRPSPGGVVRSVFPALFHKSGTAAGG